MHVIEMPSCYMRLHLRDREVCIRLTDELLTGAKTSALKAEHGGYWNSIPCHACILSGHYGDTNTRLACSSRVVTSGFYKLTLTMDLPV